MNLFQLPVSVSFSLDSYIFSFASACIFLVALVYDQAVLPVVRCRLAVSAYWHVLTVVSKEYMALVSVVICKVLY